MKFKLYLSLLACVLTYTQAFSQLASTPCAAGPLPNACSDNTITVTNSDANSGVIDPSVENGVGCNSIGSDITAGTIYDYDVWYTTTVDALGNVSVYADGTDPVVGIYSGTCGSLTLESCDDDGGTSLDALATASGLTPGQTVWIRVWDYNGGTGTYTTTATGGAAPANDDCVNAQALTLNAAPVPGTGFCATVEASDWSDCESNTEGNVWYSFTLASSGQTTVNITNISCFGSGNGVDVTIMTGNCAAFTNVICQQAISSNSAINFSGVGGTTYYVMVDGDNAGGANSLCDFDIDVDVAAPNCGTVDFHAADQANPWGPDLSPFPSTMSCTDPWIWLTANDSLTAGNYITPSLNFIMGPDNDNNDNVAIYAGGTAALGSGTLLYGPNGIAAGGLTVYGGWLSASTPYYMELCGTSTITWTVNNGGIGTVFGSGTSNTGGGCERLGPFYPEGISSFTTNAPAGSVGLIGGGWDEGYTYFDPAVSGPGTFNITYSWDDENGCTGSSTKTITVTAPYSFTSLDYNTVCEYNGSESPTLVADAGGVYSSATLGASLNTTTGVVDISTAPLGTHTVTYTLGTAPCSVDGTGTITINPRPNISGTLITCEGATTQLSGDGTPHPSLPWGSYSPGVATVSNTGLVSGVSAGTAIIAYQNQEGCLDSVTVTITALPVGTFSYTGTPYCSDEADPSPTFSGGGIAGTFTSTAGLVIASGTGVVDLSASTPGTYTVTNTIAASGGCPAVIETASITINSLPIAGISTASECENIPGSGQALNIDVTGLNAAIHATGAITWYTDNTYGTTFNPINETVDSGEVFYFEITQNGCVTQDSIMYSVSGNIMLNDPMPEFCEDVAGGGSIAGVDISAYQNAVFAGATNYNWPTVSDSTNVLITDGDSLLIEVQQGSCPTVDIYVHFTVNSLPTSNPTNMELCEDAAGSGQASFDLTSLDNTINGGTSDVVTWFTDAGISNSILTPGSFVAGDSIVYALVTNATTLCEDTAMVTLTVNPLPISNPSAMEMCDEGGNQAIFDLTSLDNTINGGTTDAVTWFTDAGTSISIPTPGAYFTGNATVYALVTDGITNCTDTAAVVLTVNPLPTVNNTSVNMCDDGSGQAIFDLTSVDNTVNGGTANVVAWFDDALATLPIGTPGAFVTGNDTVYAVVTDGTTLCMDTTDVYLILDPLPVIVDTLYQSLCEDAGTPNTVAGVDLTLQNGSIDGGAGNTLTWYTDAGLTTPVGTPTNTTVNDNDVFYVLVDNGTCSDTAIVIYEVTSTITLNAPAPVLCEDVVGSGSVSNIDLTAYNNTVYSGADTIIWYTDAGLSTPVGTPTNVTVSNGTVFYVDVTDGTCNNDTTLTFTVNGQSVGTVDSTICNGGSVTVNGTVYSSATTLSGVEVFTSANNCDSTVTVNITELPLITSTLDSTVCNGGSFVFNGTTYDAANPTGTEVLIAASGCDSTITVTLTELPLIANTLDSTVCNGGSFVFNGTTYDAANPTGTEVLIAASGCDSTITVTLTELPLITGVLDSTICSGDSFMFNGTTYDASNTSGVETLVAASGCDSLVTVTVTVNPNLSATPDAVAPICLGDALSLTATSTGSGTITWYDTDGITVIGTGSPFDATSYVSATGTYTFYVNEENGSNCDGTLTPVVVVVGGVTASIGANPSTGFVPLDVVFTNGSTTGAGITYTWDFGDGTGDNAFEPSHTYTDINSFIATLTVSDLAGCQSSATVTIEVIGESSILIPNVFTPNNDGSNDVFTVSGTNLEEVKGEIFNRWGQKMFEWDHVKGYWDGRTLSGAEAPDGTYFYIITAKGMDGVEYFKKGGFSLIR